MCVSVIDGHTFIGMVRTLIGSPSLKNAVMHMAAISPYKTGLGFSGRVYTINGMFLLMLDLITSSEAVGCALPFWVRRRKTVAPRESTWS